MNPIPDIFQALLFVACLVGMAVGIVVGMVMVRQSRKARQDTSPEGHQAQTELDALRAANQLNVAFWAAKSQLDAEARRSQGGGQP